MLFHKFIITPQLADFYEFYQFWLFLMLFVCLFDCLICLFNSDQAQIKECQGRKPQVTEINGEADVLLNSCRLDQGDVERVEKIKESLNTRYTTITDKLGETRSK